MKCLKVLVDPPPWKQGSLLSRMLPYIGIWLPVLMVHFCMVWGGLRVLGLPYLFWHDHPVQALCAGFLTTLFLGLGTFAFFGLDYSKFMDNQNRSRDFSEHWSKIEPRERHEREDSDEIVKKQSSLFRSVFLGLVFLWILMWAVSLSYQLWFRGSLFTEIEGFESSNYGPILLFLASGFVLGVVAVLGIDRIKLGPMKRHIDKKRANQSRRTGDEAAIIFHFWWAALFTLVVHFLLLLVGGNYSLPVPALIVLLAEVMLIIVFFIYMVRGIWGPFWVWGSVLALGFLLFFPFSGSEERYSLEEISLSGKEPNALLKSAEKGEPPQQDGETWTSYLFGESAADPGQSTEDPMVIICTSGGGIMAEVWTVDMLTSLQNYIFRECGIDLAGSTRLIAGASGGMVGAAAWVGNQYIRIERPQSFPARRHYPLPLELPNLRRPVSMKPENYISDFSWSWEVQDGHLCQRARSDQLSAVVHRLGIWDVLPGTVIRGRPWDRGRKLKEVWLSENCLPELSWSLDDLKSLEVNGKIPSLLFSPAVANSGRRLLISNIDVSRLTETENAVYNLDAAELLAEDWRNQPLATWAAMSASFPVVSPSASVKLSEEKSIHLLDAGYIDNFGTGVATQWLRKYWLSALDRSVAGTPRKVVLIELDAFPRFSNGKRKKTIFRAFKPESPRLIEWPLDDSLRVFHGISHRLLNEAIHNEIALDALKAEVAKFNDSVSLTCFRFTNSAEVSLSWYLAKQEQAAIKNWVQSIFQDQDDELHQGMLNKLKNALKP